MSYAPQELSPMPQHPFVDPQPVSPPESKGCSKWLIGCGIVLAVCGIVCCGVMTYAWMNKGTLIANLAAFTTRALIESSPLSDQEKQAICREVDRVRDAYIAGQLNERQLEKFAKDFADSPILPVGAMLFAEQQYVRNSGLSDEEKSAASRTLQRAARAAVERKVTGKDLEKATEKLFDKRGNNVRLKERLTDEELREVLAKLKDLADGVEIPDEEYKVDLGAETKRLVDRLLGEQPLLPEHPEDPDQPAP